MIRRSATLLWIAAMLPAFAQQKATPFFNPAEMMTIGVYYYPEAWPETQWARDIANIRKLGMEHIHMGEFAWAFMEPEEGKLNFDWLEKNVRIAAENGLKVILCTPSPTPPVWLVRRHPEVLMVDSQGRRMNHGSREHACWSAPLYRSYVEKIVIALSQRFGANPAVWGWQIDNEEYAARRTGFLYSFDNRWDIDNHPQTDRWDTMGHLLKYYKALKTLGCPVDVMGEDKELSRYPFLIAPAYQLVDERLIQRLRTYVQGGGNLMLSCRTAQKDRRGHLWEAGWAAPIIGLIGARIPMYDVLPSPVVGKVRSGGRNYDWAAWGDVLDPAGVAVWIP